MNNQLADVLLVTVQLSLGPDTDVSAVTSLDDVTDTSLDDVMACKRFTWRKSEAGTVDTYLWHQS